MAGHAPRRALSRRSASELSECGPHDECPTARRDDDYWVSVPRCRGTRRARLDVMRTPPRISVAIPVACALTAFFCLAPLARADASETITATAQVKTAAAPAASVPITVVIDKMSTDADREGLMAAL